MIKTNFASNRMFFQIKRGLLPGFRCNFVPNGGFYKDRYKMLGVFAGIFVLIFCWSQSTRAQGMAPGIKFNPKHYVSYKIIDSLAIDGRLDEAAWQKAPWTDDFVDIEGGKTSKPRFRTMAKILWDDSHLYIAAKLQEPDLWATLTERDAVIFHNNNSEVFIDPDGDTHQYYELEVNALGTFWDLMLTRPYRDGGKAIDSWDMRDLGVGIDISGTLNDPSESDSGWTVELAIPWKNLEEASADGQKPSVGDQWRINFSRVEWRLENKDDAYQKKQDKFGDPLAEDNWVWSPQGIINMHYPEMWGIVQFAGKASEEATIKFEQRPPEYLKWYLRRLYYHQHDYHKKNGTFTSDLGTLQAKKIFKELQLSELFPGLALPRIHATPQTFEIRIQNKQSGKTWYIRENGRVWSKRSS